MALSTNMALWAATNLNLFDVRKMERNSPNQISVSILLMDVSTIFSI
jgi:hypothetical protein